jgi:hypothetical protein
MTGDLDTLPAARGLAAAPLAALLFGATGMTAMAAVPSGVATLLVAVVVAIVGIALASVGRPVTRGAGVGLTVLGAHFVGIAVPSVTGTPSAEPVRYLVYLLALGLPLIAMVAFAVRGMLAPATGAGLLLPMVALQVREIGLMDVSAGSRNATATAVGMLVGAVLLTVIVVAAPARAWWGHLAGVAAATSATVAFGMGTSPVVALITFQWPLVAGPGIAPTYGWQVAVMTGALAVAAVLVLLAAVRRDVVTGLVAATVFAAPVVDALVWVILDRPVPAPALTHVALAAPLAVMTLVALLAVRVPAVRAALASVPVALRGRTLSSATTAAYAAAVAACALVAFTVQALPALGVGGRTQGALILAGLLVAGALAHFLPAPAGAAAGVVTLVGFLVAQPWALLLNSSASVPVEVVTAAFVVWVLVRRHPRVGVFAAAAYLVLGTLARLLGWVVGLSGDPAPGRTGPLVVLLLPLLVVGLPAAVFAWRDRNAPVAQAVGAVVLGSAMYLPMKQFLLAYVTPELFVEGIDPFAPTDAMAATQHLREFGWPVALVLVALALVLVASVVRRPSTALAVTAALLVFCVGRVAGSLVADVAVLAWVLGALAVASAAVAWFTVRRA